MTSYQPASQYTVTIQDEGQRLDNFLMREYKSLPKSHIYRWIRSGQVRINSGRIKPSYKLEIDDLIRIPPLHTDQSEKPLIKKTVNWLKDCILYEDEECLVVNKPKGLPVHGGSGHQHGLIELLRHYYDNPRVELIHRLDKSTSGCLLIAKKRQVLRPLMAQLTAGQVNKSYLAKLDGRLARNKTVRFPLMRTQCNHQDKMIVDPKGKPAVSHFEVLQATPESTAVRVRLETGRMHQIRAHAKAIDHAIVGDPLYHEDKPEDSLWLHAETLSFTHPITKKFIEVVAPLPAEQAGFFAGLAEIR